MDTPHITDTPKTNDPGLKSWIEAKKARGEWLSDEDYAKQNKTPSKPFQSVPKPFSR